MALLVPTLRLILDGGRGGVDEGTNASDLHKDKKAKTDTDDTMREGAELDPFPKFTPKEMEIRNKKFDEWMYSQAMVFFQARLGQHLEADHANIESLFEKSDVGEYTSSFDEGEDLRNMFLYALAPGERENRPGKCVTTTKRQEVMDHVLQKLKPSLTKNVIRSTGPPMNCVMKINYVITGADYTSQPRGKFTMYGKLFKPPPIKPSAPLPPAEPEMVLETPTSPSQLSLEDLEEKTYLQQLKQNRLTVLTPEALQSFNAIMKDMIISEVKGELQGLASEEEATLKKSPYAPDSFTRKIQLTAPMRHLVAELHHFKSHMELAGMIDLLCQQVVTESHEYYPGLFDLVLMRGEYPLGQNHTDYFKMKVTPAALPVPPPPSATLVRKYVDCDDNAAVPLTPFYVQPVKRLRYIDDYTTDKMSPLVYTLSIAAAGTSGTPSVPPPPPPPPPPAMIIKLSPSATGHAATATPASTGGTGAPPPPPPTGTGASSASASTSTSTSTSTASPGVPAATGSGAAASSTPIATGVPAPPPPVSLKTALDPSTTKQIVKACKGVTQALIDIAKMENSTRTFISQASGKMKLEYLAVKNFTGRTIKAAEFKEAQKTTQEDFVRLTKQYNRDMKKLRSSVDIIIQTSKSQLIATSTPLVDAMRSALDLLFQLISELEFYIIYELEVCDVLIAYFVKYSSKGNIPDDTYMNMAFESYTESRNLASQSYDRYVVNRRAFVKLELFTKAFCESFEPAGVVMALEDVSDKVLALKISDSDAVAAFSVLVFPAKVASPTFVKDGLNLVHNLTFILPQFKDVWDPLKEIAHVFAQSIISLETITQKESEVMLEECDKQAKRLHENAGKTFDHIGKVWQGYMSDIKTFKTKLSSSPTSRVLLAIMDDLLKLDVLGFAGKTRLWESEHARIISSLASEIFNADKQNELFISLSKSYAEYQKDTVVFTRQLNEVVRVLETLLQDYNVDSKMSKDVYELTDAISAFDKDLPTPYEQSQFNMTAVATNVKSWVSPVASSNPGTTPTTPTTPTSPHVAIATPTPSSTPSPPSSPVMKPGTPLSSMSPSHNSATGSMVDLTSKGILNVVAITTPASTSTGVMDPFATGASASVVDTTASSATPSSTPAKPSTDPNLTNEVAAKISNACAELVTALKEMQEIEHISNQFNDEITAQMTQNYDVGKRQKIFGILFERAVQMYNVGVTYHEDSMNKAMETAHMLLTDSTNSLEVQMREVFDNIKKVVDDLKSYVQLEVDSYKNIVQFFKSGGNSKSLSTSPKVQTAFETYNTLRHDAPKKYDLYEHHRVQLFDLNFLAEFSRQKFIFNKLNETLKQVAECADEVQKMTLVTKFTRLPFPVEMPLPTEISEGFSLLNKFCDVLPGFTLVFEPLVSAYRVYSDIISSIAYAHGPKSSLSPSPISSFQELGGLMNIVATQLKQLRDQSEKALVDTALPHWDQFVTQVRTLQLSVASAAPAWAPSSSLSTKFMEVLDFLSEISLDAYARKIVLWAESNLTAIAGLVNHMTDRDEWNKILDTQYLANEQYVLDMYSNRRSLSKAVESLIDFVRDYDDVDEPNTKKLRDAINNFEMSMPYPDYKDTLTYHMQMAGVNVGKWSPITDASGGSGYTVSDATSMVATPNPLIPSAPTSPMAVSPPPSSSPVTKVVVTNATLGAEMDWKLTQMHTAIKDLNLHYDYFVEVWPKYHQRCEFLGLNAGYEAKFGKGKSNLKWEAGAAQLKLSITNLTEPNVHIPSKMTKPYASETTLVNEFVDKYNELCDLMILYNSNMNELNIKVCDLMDKGIRNTAYDGSPDPAAPDVSEEQAAVSQLCDLLVTTGSDITTRWKGLKVVVSELAVIFQKGSGDDHYKMSFAEDDDASLVAYVPYPVDPIKFKNEADKLMNEIIKEKTKSSDGASPTPTPASPPPGSSEKMDDTPIVPPPPSSPPTVITPLPDSTPVPVPADTENILDFDDFDLDGVDPGELMADDASNKIMAGFSGDDPTSTPEKTLPLDNEDSTTSAAVAAAIVPAPVLSDDGDNVKKLFTEVLSQQEHLMQLNTQFVESLVPQLKEVNSLRSELTKKVSDTQQKSIYERNTKLMKQIKSGTENFTRASQNDASARLGSLNQLQKLVSTMKNPKYINLLAHMAQVKVELLSKSLSTMATRILECHILSSGLSEDPKSSKFLKDCAEEDKLLRSLRGYWESEGDAMETGVNHLISDVSSGVYELFFQPKTITHIDFRLMGDVLTFLLEPASLNMDNINKQFALNAKRSEWP